MGAGGCLEKWARDSRTFPQLHDGAQHPRTWKPSCVCCLAACTPPTPISPPLIHFSKHTCPCAPSCGLMETLEPTLPVPWKVSHCDRDLLKDCRVEFYF
ncbi:Receptor-type tyrosine-protein phosphatase zeta [Manis javanica]|nr:Receptor-type tyrosine-protein phosphatase zeta [Manis javanica]